MSKITDKKPTQTCKVDTPVGVIEGKKCSAGDELYHRTHPDNLGKILREGKIKAGEEQHTIEETGVVSMSSNPAHTYGGTIRFIIDPEDIDAEPVCYYGDDAEKPGELEQKMMEEDPTVAPNEWRARFGIQPRSSYGKECEYFSEEDVDLENVEKMEYWYPWDKPSHVNVKCREVGPPYARGDLWGTEHFENNKEKIRWAKENAEAFDIPFEVRSCFKWLKKKRNPDQMGSLDEWCKLDEDNLERLEEGEELVCQNEKPEVFEDGPVKREDIDKVCRC